uniref:Uncharacterized protein n=1 Tax=Hanusia phi TaxID=3032 RepID=A0A7S0I2J0_9CRYP
MYLWWGPSTNHRFVGSGEHIRHLLHMGQVEGGEWRDPMFLGNNGVATFRSQRFRKISETCCSTIVIPPMEWDFPVYNTHKMIGQRIRNFVANGNMLVLTGGILAVEFINSYFFYNIELADGNYSPGPYRRLKDVPECMLQGPEVLPQKGISVTAVKKDSLPSGTEVLWGTPRSSPVFMIKFCEAQSPDEGMPPTKVLPRDCPLAERDGRPCSCGYIMYIGYNYQEQYPTRWDRVLRGAVEIMNPSYSTPQRGYKGNKEVVIPGTPPCLQKGAKEYDWPNSGAYSTSKVPKANLASQPEEKKESRGRVPNALARADQKIDAQQKEIDALENQVRTLSEQREEAAMRRAGAASSESLNQLKSQAHQLLHEVHAREARRSRKQNTETSLVKAVSTLSKDVENIDTKMNHLTKIVSARHKKVVDKYGIPNGNA